jgi:CheY-like chemotaxis protein
MNPPPALLREHVRPSLDAFRNRFPLGLRVLVVDDNTDAADSLGELLGLVGAEVRVRYDGPAGLDAARDLRPQAGVLDIDMPGMDGCELARRLGEAAGSEPLLLVAVTGVSDPAARERARAAGFALHLAKPAEPEEVLLALGNYAWWLGARNQAAALRREPGHPG